MFAEQYKGRKVFVTGHTGFKGSWLCAWLKSLGAEVCGYSIGVVSSPSGFQAMNLLDSITDLRGDVCDVLALKEAISSFEPDIIFHLAAQALVRPSYENPVDTFTINAMGTMHVFDVARKVKGLKALISITSDKCYRNDEWEWGYRETDHLGGTDPYSASKACAEIIAHSYMASFYNDTHSPLVATVRAGNVIGGGDWALDRIVPDCAKAYGNKKSVFIRNPYATRPWQHVLEPLSGYLWLGARMLCGEKKGLHAESFNFGPPTVVNATVKEVTLGLAKYWDGFSIEEAKEEFSVKECNLLKLCCDKALSRLQWKATLNFDETIAYTASWYQEYYNQKNKNMYSYTKKQIKEYEELALCRGLSWAK